MINLYEEPLDDLADLLEFMEHMDDETALRIYGFTRLQAYNVYSRREKLEKSSS